MNRSVCEKAERVLASREGEEAMEGLWGEWVGIMCGD
jgi:hypothetical protein